MTSASLFLDIAGERWAVDVPARWAARFQMAFRHLVAGEGGATAVTVASRDAASPEEARWAHAIVAGLPEEDAVAAMRVEGVRIHVSRLSIESWEEASAQGASVLLDPLAESNYLGTNLLINQLVWRAESRRLIPLHAAAIGNDAGVWLIPADAGQGKSTLAAAAAAAGLRFFGDDFVLLDAERLVVHSLYATLRLAPPALRLVEEHFGADRLELIGTRDDAKRLLTPSSRTPDVCQRAGVLRGILIPDRTGTVRLGDTAAPARALRAFASTLRLLVTFGYPTRTAFRKLGDVTRRVDARFIETGPDLTALVRALSLHMEGRG